MLQPILLVTSIGLRRRMEAAGMPASTRWRKHSTPGRDEENLANPRPKRTSSCSMNRMNAKRILRRLQEACITHLKKNLRRHVKKTRLKLLYTPDGHAIMIQELHE